MSRKIKQNPVGFVLGHPAGKQGHYDDLRQRHELEVYQANLEMQQQALVEARNHLEYLVGKYTDLYDFAPVGYFSLDPKARIIEVNLHGAALLGSDRSSLVGRSFLLFVPRSKRPGFLAFLEGVFSGADVPTLEGVLKGAGMGLVRVDFKATASRASPAAPSYCRLSVQAATEESLPRVRDLALRNNELKDEIQRRMEVEGGLRLSQEKLKRLLDQSKGLEGRFRQLARLVIHSQEEDRKRISRELHDEIAQILVGIGFHLGALKQQADAGPQVLSERIQVAQGLVRDSVEAVCRFAHDLRPAVLDDLGLVPALRSYFEWVTRHSGLKIQFAAFSGADRLDVSKRTVLFRVAQEALANVLRHAQATKVEVALRRESGRISLRIEDDGVGFDVVKTLRFRNSKSLGVRGMQERAEMVGGMLSVVSAPGQGARVELIIPPPPRPERSRRPLAPGADPKPEPL